jgi:hypothetical protein
VATRRTPALTRHSESCGRALHRDFLGHAHLTLSAAADTETCQSQRFPIKGVVRCTRSVGGVPGLGGERPSREPATGRSGPRYRPSAQIEGNANEDFSNTPPIAASDPGARSSRRNHTARPSHVCHRLTDPSAAPEGRPCVRHRGRSTERPARTGGHGSGRSNMSSKPRRLAMLAVATTLATAPGAAQAASPQSPTYAKPSAHWVVVSDTAAIKPPASVTGLARDLGVDTDFAWRTLDELARSAVSPVRAAAPTRPSRPAWTLTGALSGMSQPPVRGPPA